MVSLQGKIIKLRALEKEDLDFLFALENNPSVWEISGTITPYSRDVLTLYLDNAHRDIYDVKQLRLVICTQDDEAIGLVDLFDFDPKNRRAGIGIIINEEGNRNSGAGTESLQILCQYAFSTLQLRQLYANILEGNERSLHLFKKLGFELVGTKKDWIFNEGRYKNELLFQKINK
ncbi:GNAT family N-acetyltransferase [Maribacter sp. PR1]|uniref:GNAT family N-acetyltransferase n=1 Tax=Maribacter cobaltidurans TaxID=1178778 RepID=A0ABU7IVG2_9FLAO|nr:MULTISPECIES: GNAT family N-acetyltransferase [Maribacter]MDC6389552.1 GNAT family N-acetyltransferase [Maribacter sp. PR1]MEE1976941.1 GNAT family N-acetyltransferase [Maribacter cobaltidurans]